MSKNIKRFFESISESIDYEAALKNENRFFAIVASISLIMGAFFSFVVLYLINGEALGKTVYQSMVLLAIGLSFLLFNKLKNEVLKMYLNAILVSSVIVFSYNNYYDLIGPGVWAIAFLMTILILVFSRIEILLIFLATNFLVNIKAWIEGIKFDNWDIFYLSNIIIIAVVSLAVIVLFNVYKSRQEKIIEQYNRILLSEEKLYSTLISVGDGVISVNEKGLIDYMNPKAESLTGWKIEKAKGLRFEVVFKIINGKTREQIDSPVQSVFDSLDLVELSQDTLLINLDGKEIPIEDTAAPIKNKQGQIVGVVLVFRDITAQIQKRLEMERVSHTDHLTNVYNRRYFEAELRRLNHEKYLPLSVVYIDINGLKMINDAFGHEHGDDLIREVAEGLKSGCRNTDIIARLGGDEFVILLPLTSLDLANEIIERIKSTLENKKILDLEISFSFGLATRLNVDEDVERVLKNAEDMMYENKINNAYEHRNSVIESIQSSLFNRSPYEKRHSNNVGRLCAMMGEALGLSDNDISELKEIGEIHDIGKIGIEQSLLNQLDEITSGDWSHIMSHPEIGYRILITSRDFHHVAEIILEHHERWDGTGYPKCLKGDEISKQARILSIAETYDDLTSDKLYKKALSMEEATKEIKLNSGTQFDPELVSLFLDKVLPLLIKL